MTKKSKKTRATRSRSGSPTTPHSPGLRPATSPALALESTAPNALRDAYYEWPINQPTNVTFDASTRSVAQGRCEREYLNDPIVYSAVRKVVALTVGTGPTLKLTGPRTIDPITLDRVEQKLQYLESAWQEYAEAVDLWDKLRLACGELLYHGEAILRKVIRDDVLEQFDYVPIRPDRLENVFKDIADPFVFDGIRYDRPTDGGRPVIYYIRREYINPINISIEYDEVPADEILHVYEGILPQQRRGIPQLQTALPRIAEMRQLVKATMAASINSAKAAIVLKTDNSEILQSLSDNDSLNTYSFGKTFEFADGGLFAPPGYEPVFCDPKHPTAEFGPTKKLLCGDIGATIGLGSGKVNNDHSTYNYSSAKMDEQIDVVIANINQGILSQKILNPILDDWLNEYAMRDATAREVVWSCGRLGRKWLFPEPRSLDILKDAQADDIRLKNGSTTLSDIYARSSRDSVEQIAVWQSEQVGCPADNESSTPMITEDIDNGTI